MRQPKLVRALDILGTIAMLVLIPLWVVLFLIMALALWLAGLVGLRAADAGIPGCVPQALMAVMLALGLSYLGWAGVDALKSISLLSSGTETLGTVTATPLKRFDRYAIIAYTVDGRTYSVTPLSPFGTTLKTGDTVPVLYDPARPERAGVSTFGSMWLQPALLVGMALLCCGAAWHMFRDQQRGLGLMPSS